MSSPEEPTLTYVDMEKASVYLAKAIRDPQAEFEWIFGGTSHTASLNKLQFLRLLHYLKGMYPCVAETNTLDIKKQYVRVKGPILGNIRCTIEGIADIREYCRTNDIDALTSVSYMEKSTYQDPQNPTLNYSPITNHNFNHRINLKREMPLESTNTEVEGFRKSLRDSLKHYRYKKRFSFLTPDSLFRIDLTSVKTSEYNVKTHTSTLFRSFVESGVLKGPESYEIEVEFVGAQPPPGTSEPLLPIDTFVNTVIASDGSVSKDVCMQSQKHGQNIFSQVEVMEGSPGDELLGVEVPGEFTVASPPPALNVGFNLNDPMSDIHYEYWVRSKQEWFLDAMTICRKSLTFVRLLENTTASYPGAPEKVSYAEFRCVPEFSPEDIEGYTQEYPDGDFEWRSTLLIPLSEIQGTHVDPGTLSLSQLKESERTRLRKTVITKVLTILDKTIYPLLCQIHGTNLFVGQTVRNDVLRNYKTVTEQQGSTRFLGPDPVTLSLKEMVPEHPHSILQGYVVTEKADGIRAQLLVHAGEGHLILGKKLGVIQTGLQFTNVQGMWVFDGEYITSDKMGNPTRLFMIFDVYYAGDGGEAKLYPGHAYTYPWLSLSKTDITRSRILEEFKRQVRMVPKETIADPVTVGFKTYYDGPRLLRKTKTGTWSNLSGMGKVCKKIFSLDAKKEGYGYTIDGLIFMPVNFPVKSMNETPVSQIGGTWSINYKWKPPEENTIDFRVEFVKEASSHLDKITTTMKDGELLTCKQVRLIVGYNESDDPACDFAWKVMTGNTSRPKKEVPFQPPSNDPDSEPSLHLCNLPLDDGKILCQRDKVELKDGMIVEMQYCPTHPEGSRWLPLRERSDKKDPQYFLVANSVWDTIMNPVTKDMITGTKELLSVPELLGDALEEGSQYYVAQDGMGVDGPLRKFHNYIKHRLISDVASGISKKNIAILDTSVGRGGDLKKYLNIRKDISFFLGLDISPDVNEAAKRYYTERMKKPQAMFIQYDTSHPIHTGEGCVGTPHTIDKNHHLIDILYKNHKKVPKDYRKIDGSYRGLGEAGFDLISSQFTLHYYFKDELTLRGYIQNLSDSCVQGGYFIGTCYDGMKVFQMLRESKVLDMTDEFGKRVYSITKQYEIDDFTYHKDDKEAMFGQKIDVYMSSIGQNIHEYLVNFEMFIDLMNEYGFSLATPSLSGKNSGIFDNQSYSYKPGLGPFDSILSNLAKLSSQDMTLKKQYSDALQMLHEDNAGLRQLSVLNNWFIFQKK
jgi:hypothetical protein